MTLRPLELIGDAAAVILAHNVDDLVFGKGSGLSQLHHQLGERSYRKYRKRLTWFCRLFGWRRGNFSTQIVVTSQTITIVSDRSAFDVLRDTQRDPRCPFSSQPLRLGDFGRK